ncbi:MAG TPA: DegQ family serine endoprotease [Bryobacterales bacterium]|nr:DegQ family serine endoprotease [Bryobacterales bacterium]
MSNVWTRSRRAFALLITSAALGALVVAGAVVHSSTGANPPASFQFADPHEGPSRNSFAPVVKKTLPAVVNISTSKIVKTPTGFSGEMPMDPFFRRFFGDEFGNSFNAPRERRERSLGSGVIVSREGYILTNNHVIDGATDIRVTLSDKRELKARLIGADAKTDIAVLKVDAANLPFMVLGDSSKAQVGDFVLAIGNPFGLGGTVTMGIISATGRGNLGIEDYEDFIQTDAPINPGNSGGALVNDRGELIGINTAILSRSGGNQGVGFAVPINLARTVTDQILKTGHVTRGYLGIMLQPVTPAIAKAFGLKEAQGALVADVEPNSPAQRSGVEKGDIILAVNGKAVTDVNQLRLSISMMAPGSAVDLKVFRNGADREIRAELGEMPSKQERASLENNGSGGALDGVDVQDLTPETAGALHLPPQTRGVVVTRIDPASEAAGSGLQEGDVIQEVNHQPVRNSTDFNRALRQSAQAGKPSLLLVDRQGTTLFIAV